jgi:hypothetical protein
MATHARLARAVLTIAVLTLVGVALEAGKRWADGY